MLIQDFEMKFCLHDLGGNAIREQNKGARFSRCDLLKLHEMVMVRWATRLADKIVDIGQRNNGGWHWQNCYFGDSLRRQPRNAQVHDVRRSSVRGSRVSGAYDVKFLLHVFIPRWRCKRLQFQCCGNE